MTRDYIAPGSPAPFPTGKSAFRWLLPVETMKQSSNTREVVERTGIIAEWAANDRRLVAYPCSNDTVYNLCAFVPRPEAGITDLVGRCMKLKVIPNSSMD